MATQKTIITLDALSEAFFVNDYNKVSVQAIEAIAEKNAGLTFPGGVVRQETWTGVFRFLADFNVTNNTKAFSGLYTPDKFIYDSQNNMIGLNAYVSLPFNQLDSRNYPGAWNQTQVQVQSNSMLAGSRYITDGIGNGYIQLGAPMPSYIYLASELEFQNGYNRKYEQGGPTGDLTFFFHGSLRKNGASISGSSGIYWRVNSNWKPPSTKDVDSVINYSGDKIYPESACDAVNTLVARGYSLPIWFDGVSPTAVFANPASPTQAEINALSFNLTRVELGIEMLTSI